MVKDNNLKLMLMERSRALSSKHFIGRDNDYEKFCLMNFGRIIDFNRDSYGINKTIEAFLLNIELTQEDLLDIVRLTIDGDYSIFPLLTKDFLVQKEYFYVKSLEGIQSCKNIKTLNLGTMSQGVDLHPLSQLPNLEKVILTSYSATNYIALLSVKSLMYLHIYNWITFSNSDIIELTPILKKLKERGCNLIFRPPMKWTELL